MTHGRPSAALIPGTFNSRDLGGLCAGARRLRRGRLIRSDAPVQLGDRGRARLGELGVRTALDLREPTEREHAPADIQGLDVALLTEPLLGPLATQGGANLQRIYDGLLETRGRAFACAVATVAAAVDEPVLFFCSAGKDRTGLLSALILALLGVDEEQIVADYHLTEENMWGPFRERVVAAAIASGLSEQEIAVGLGAPRDLVRGVLARLGAEGGAEAYLMRHGLPASTSARLRDALLEP